MSARMTLLELTQEILSALESDEVNSISDTVESLQVAGEVRTTYYELLTALKIPTNQKLMSLQALSDPAFPNYLKIPDNVQGIEWVKYKNVDDQYIEIRYVSPEDFLMLTTGYETSQPTTQVSDILEDTIQFKIVTNADPKYWTTFDNQYLVFDSLNLEIESSLQQSKCLVKAQVVPDFRLDDGFVPQLDIFLFPLLLAEAKKACFVNFKGISNANEERRARRQMVRSQNDLWRADQRRPYNRTPDYGRRRR